MDLRTVFKATWLNLLLHIEISVRQDFFVDNNDANKNFWQATEGNNDDDKNIE